MKMSDLLHCIEGRVYVSVYTGHDSHINSVISRELPENLEMDADICQYDVLGFEISGNSRSGYELTIWADKEGDEE